MIKGLDIVNTVDIKISIIEEISGFDKTNGDVRLSQKLQKNLGRQQVYIWLTISGCHKDVNRKDDIIYMIQK